LWKGVDGTNKKCESAAHTEREIQITGGTGYPGRAKHFQTPSVGWGGKVTSIRKIKNRTPSEKKSTKRNVQVPNRKGKNTKKVIKRRWGGAGVGGGGAQKKGSLHGETRLA